jgi:outer membrane protein
MQVFRQLPLCLAVSAALFAALPFAAQAQNLVELYDAARGYDAAFQAARRLHDANQTKPEQARAGLLPAANLTGSVQRSYLQAFPDLGGGAANVDRIFGSNSATVSASQPLYRPANLITYNQSLKQLDLADAQLLAAEQDLLIRVSQAYFDVLASQDSLNFVKAQKIAVAEQLAFAKRNFEVGTSTITDTREAQARFDLVIAQEIAAENDLRVKKLAVDQLVGKTETQPKPLNGPIELPPLSAHAVENWVTLSQDQHPAIKQAKVAVDIAELETAKAEAGHKPTVDLVANYTGTRNNGGTSASGVSGVGSKVYIGTIGVNLTLPLFAGYATQGRIKETLALEDKARSDLDAVTRNVAQATRAAYFGVLSGQGQVKALQAAEASSQSALDANKLGYQVGVRINIDVLNSQSQLFQTKRDLAKARYDVLLGGLKLRQANGTLRAEDLAVVNTLIAQ